MRAFSRIAAILLLVVVVHPIYSGFADENTPTISTIKQLFTGSDYLDGLRFRCVGPSRGGRVTAVAGVASQPGTFYMGATGGGVWKTTDYGITWRNISDGYFKTPSIGAIRVSESNPDLIYVGTGSEAIRSNVITGKGVYKSADAGKTWQCVGLEDAGQIGAVIIHPENPDIVFVAAMGHAFGPNDMRGVFRTRDGGKTWEKVLFLSDTTGAVDLEFAPDNPNEIYACLWRAERKPWTIISGGREGGVYKSTDGGDTWNKLTNGLPTGIIGKTDLAVSPADPNRVYVLVEAPEGLGGLYRSDDRGQHFRRVSDKRELLDRPFYYLNVDADPTNADVVYVNTTGFWKSEDGGKTWRRLRTPHGDNHDMWINPNNSNIFIQSNDGGANITQDGGRTWSRQDNQPTAELYQVNVDDQFPYWLYAGQQDNSTIAVPSLPPYPSPAGATGYWLAVGGCETGPAVPKPGDPNIVYANCKGRFGRYNKLTGQEQQYYVGAADMYGHNPKDLKYRFQRVSPIFVSPHDPNVIYHCSQYVHKTTDEGKTWEIISPDLTAFEPDKQVYSGTPITRDITGEEFYSTIYALQESPVQQGVIWVGANDGPVHITTDGGKTWKNVTPPGLPPGGRVQTVEPSPHHAGKAYVAVYRFLLDDWHPYIFRTDNFGKSWTLLTTGDNGIPADFPTRVIREDPRQEGLLYAGTEFGLFISFDDGRTWLPFQLNLPVTPVTDIKIHRDDLVLSTMGRSFWILDNVTPLRELAAVVGNKFAHLFAPRPAYRMRYRPSFGRSPAEPEYPPPGAHIDYFLASEVEGEILLEILDAQGQLVRRFSSKQGETRESFGEEMRYGRRFASRPRLKTTPGVHRFVWDLRRQVATESGLRGPIVTPGTYEVRLTVAGRTDTRALEIRLDPRVAADGVTLADLQEQEALSLKIAALSERANRLAEAVGNVLKTDPQNAAAKTLQKKLVTDRSVAYPTPMLIDQIEYLYNMLDQADQKPGKDAYLRYDELQAQLTDLERQFAGVKK